MSDFDPKDMRSGSLSRYLTDDAEGWEERAGSLARYLPREDNADDED